MVALGADVDETKQPPGVMSVLCLVALKRRLWLLPILTAGWLFSSFWISYGIAVSYNHTEADFPYISHTAIEAPERCVFGQMVNIGAVMLGLNVILRYLFVKNLLILKKTPPTNGWFKINLVGIFLGILSAFGLSMVANFQTGGSQRAPHYFGAGLAFFLGGIYCWIQTALSYKVLFKFRRERLLMILQIVNSVILTLMLFLFVSTKLVYKLRHAKGLGTKWGALRGVYLTSTITEWLLALSVLTFTLTFAPNFKNMRVDDPRIYLEENFETSTHSKSAVQHSDTNGNVQAMEEGAAKVT